MNSSITELSLHIIILRIFLSTIIGGIIGYERGSNNQAAGFRTHILVCLGATLISLIQEQLKINLLNYAIENPLSSQVLKTDLGRLGAQVISGIGFLGAGTILREEKTIAGLTTAASVWVTGCIGLGIGWGFYRLTIITGIVVLIVLITLKKIEVIYKTIIITYTEDNTSTTRVPNLIPITVNPYYNKLVVHVGNLGVDSIDSVTWKETQAKSNVFSILLAFQTLSSRQLNNRGFSLIILNLGDLVDLPTKPCAIYSRAA